jgi:hypothetical protein
MCIDWKLMFDAIWPRHKAKIDIVVSSIERTCLLMTDEVRLEHISEAYKARTADVHNWEKTFKFQEQQNFNTVENCISPKLYDDELDRLRRSICERTGSWLKREQVLKRWLDLSDRSTRLVWLQGIPGAGRIFGSSILCH